ncbi:hypothetical protein EJV47_25525 [Hymenobacter gummosus]|uniref:DUF349 domain-containing protein n=1 Tax=Hymenobacter gummosus TaxID=1776032 RepID=A0A3S0J5R0_9BACT|nr:DUF6565 domain-containing protein [Hymenobacter gummosus]RTQ45241.1 hypothetical protein EJV47_25525 [Hymenobacter gummosus]
MNHILRSTAFAAALLLAASASAQTTPAKTSTKTTPAKTPSKASTTTDRVLSDVEQDLGIFRDWVNDKLDKADVVTKRELPRIKEEYDTQSTRIDRAVDSLTAAGKREYEGLKNRYENWETRQERLEKEASQPATAQQTQTRILGENVNLATARASEMTDLYGRFIDYVRTNRKNWTAEDWAQASAVLTRLNQRYEKVREQIPTDDRLRIRSWQGEFRTLEQAKKTKEAVSE